MPGNNEPERSEPVGEAQEIDSPAEISERLPSWAIWPEGQRSELAKEIVKIRYEHILAQIRSVNENVFRFLAIYQTLISALVAGQVLLFINHTNWSLSRSVTRVGLIGILTLETMVAVFAGLMIIVGIFSWLDYRFEENDISDAVVGPNFRKRPSQSNWYRWYETYIIAFIFLSIITVWILVLAFMIPSV